MIWKTHIEDDLKFKCQEQVSKIASFLSTKILEKPKSEKIGLINGKLGIAIFFAHLFNETKDNNYLALYQEGLSEIINFLNTNEVPLKYSTGLSGICWGLNHLYNIGAIIGDDIESLSKIDFLIGKKMLNNIHLYKDYDFLHGPIGDLLYLLDRPRNYELDQILNSAVEALFSISEINDDEIIWRDYITFAGDQDSHIDKKDIYATPAF